MVNRLLAWAAGSTQLQRQATGNPLARRVAYRYVAGNELEDALAVAEKLNASGIGAILDMLGEGVTDQAGATHAVEQYEDAVSAIASRGLDANISIKLSSLGQTVNREACLENLNRLLEHAKSSGVGVEVDMEDRTLVSDTLAIFRDAVTTYPGTRLAMQVALRRTPLDLEALEQVRPRVRLVKGAYADPVEVALQGKSEIRAQYKFLTEWLFEHADDPAFGTHDDVLISHAKEAAHRAGKGPKDYEFQLLYGIRRDLQQALANQGHRVRVYIPFGHAWYPYFVRRLAERPSNLVFFLRALVGK